MLSNLHFSDLGLPTDLQPRIRLNSARTVTEGIVRPTITSDRLCEEMTAITGVGPEEFSLSTRVFDLVLHQNDQVLVRAAGTGLPLIVCRDGEVIVNFDIRATQAFEFVDSKRPIYTYIPGFNIQKVPVAIRRPLSNLVQSLSSPKCSDVEGRYRRLPLTSFEFVMVLLYKILARDQNPGIRLFRWPSGLRAVFLSMHDVDTGGLLRRRERDPLFLLEEKHAIRSTWFIPTEVLKERRDAIDFLFQRGHEVGWHGYNHDHRLPFKPFAEQRLQILKNSYLGRSENFPTGMRTPKLLKSNHLFDILDRSYPTVCYDTSFARGIVPYYIWVNGRQSRILEIPTTVPSDMHNYNELHGRPRSRRFEIILAAQIARTQRLYDVGAVISIVTHAETDLSEQPEFLEVYDQYLSYIKSCSEMWFATAGELFKYWTAASGSMGSRECS
jgi:peptidoglycan/xylan/chitin deacetylase (PgdA/CDA1 family)